MIGGFTTKHLLACLLQALRDHPGHNVREPSQANPQAIVCPARDRGRKALSQEVTGQGLAEKGRRG